VQQLVAFRFQPIIPKMLDQKFVMTRCTLDARKMDI